VSYFLTGETRTYGREGTFYVERQGDRRTKRPN